MISYIPPEFGESLKITKIIQLKPDAQCFLLVFFASYRHRLYCRGIMSNKYWDFNQMEGHVQPEWPVESNFS